MTGVDGCAIAGLAHNSGIAASILNHVYRTLGYSVRSVVRFIPGSSGWWGSIL